MPDTPMTPEELAEIRARAEAAALKAALVRANIDQAQEAENVGME